MMTNVVSVQGTAATYTTEPQQFSRRVIEGTPQRLEVLDSQGVAAVFTVGAKTVVLRGASRRFTEQKRPFTDSFARTLANGWGPSPGGGVWSNANGSDSLYSVSNGVGSILLDATNVSRHVSVRDSGIGDCDVSVKATIDKTPVTAGVSCAVSFAYQDTNNHYRARLLFSSASGNVQLSLEREVDNAVTVLGPAVTLGSGFQPHDWWNIRVQKKGNALSCRAWKDGTAEPSTWTHTTTDATFATGRVGVRAIASSGNSALPINAKFADFKLRSGQWATPPTVVHSTWVRLLDQPFDGSWSEALAQRVRSWLVDQTPDVLAYAWMFVTGAATVTDPLLSGKRIFGQADYGPLATDGTRYEGSDWNDFIGTSWTYRTGEARTFPHGNVTSPGGLDCSGYVRMVFGRCLGIPLVYKEGLDGISLPRTTRDMAPNGPGVVVISSAGAPPASLSDLQIGDVLFFDADESDPTEGQIDHCGIYVGTDANGEMRFVSSRKTANGPTFSDLGGPSVINGTSNYSTRLRTVRRF
ncbi:C40 family peptidase [Streptomyces sp. NPDC057854]|uniref:C40 family peptidase n=1 Tax=unclassified Streptomyces TaxID=2593676 RepID=UPI0036C5039E